MTLFNEPQYEKHKTDRAQIDEYYQEKYNINLGKYEYLKIESVKNSVTYVEVEIKCKGLTRKIGVSFKYSTGDVLDIIKAADKYLWNHPIYEELYFKGELDLSLKPSSTEINKSRFYCICIDKLTEPSHTLPNSTVDKNTNFHIHIVIVSNSDPGEVIPYII